jgi:hypothetical protein
MSAVSEGGEASADGRAHPLDRERQQTATRERGLVSMRRRLMGPRAELRCTDVCVDALAASPVLVELSRAHPALGATRAPPVALVLVPGRNLFEDSTCLDERLSTWEDEVVRVLADQTPGLRQPLERTL